ncbi:MAG: 1-acyl-sn-glycerol-3-phosphate acyltransferase [Xanthobacteraceae bacterium]|nr:1-acyl-sn-glycerol-3-phosphate acyltransferase [Xanthobacteraceae bacterium]MBV9626895.1 1-acyl-sn-glycerol-3-phosphate acyltransferase [Xanthobacteraceae bacterium]
MPNAISASFVALVARSLLFNVAFYLNLFLHMLVAIPTFVLPQPIMVQISRSWGATSLWLLRTICGIKVEWHGREKIPPGPLLVAAKHQSAWETFALLPLFPNPTAIVKRELFRIPLFGWCMWKCGMIGIDRSSGRDALTGMVGRTRAALARGRQVIIFPEGTRRAPGAAPDYKLGIVQLYAGLDAPCLPIALNSGLFWPRRRFVRYPGTVRVEILDPLPPHLPKREFFARLRHDIETATARLVAQGERDVAA